MYFMSVLTSEAVLPFPPGREEQGRAGAAREGLRVVTSCCSAAQGGPLLAEVLEKKHRSEFKFAAGQRGPFRDKLLKNVQWGEPLAAEHWAPVSELHQKYLHCDCFPCSEIHSSCSQLLYCASLAELRGKGLRLLQHCNS